MQPKRKTVYLISILIILIIGLIMKGLNLTFGLRNNNPFNLRSSVKNRWQGQNGENNGFCTFDTIENGIRAGVINLKNGYFSKGLTVAQIISKYAPVTDRNNTDNYIKFVSSYSGVKSDQVPTPLQYRLICEAIYTFENGSVFRVPSETINKYI